MDWFEGYIAHYPGVQGGGPVIKGTRTPVIAVVALHATYAGDMAAMLSALPHVTETQVNAALAYYEHHRAEVDREEQRHERAMKALLAAS